MRPCSHWVNKPLIREGGIVIGIGRCTGHIDENAHASYREILDLFSKCHSSYEFQEYEEEFLHRENLIFKYRHCHSYAPIHPFWLLYESQYTLDWAGKSYFRLKWRFSPAAARKENTNGQRQY